MKGGVVNRDCGHCCHLRTENGIRCGKRGEKISEAAAKAPNGCHDFVLDPVGAFGNGGPYSPAKSKRREQCEGQLELFGKK